MRAFTISDAEDVPLTALDLESSLEDLAPEQVAWIMELADSIEMVGQLTPIIVAPTPTDPTRYFVVNGLLRVLAHQELLRRDPSRVASIQAQVVSRALTREECRAMGRLESPASLPASKRDLIAVTSYFFSLYGSKRKVAAETGLPLQTVRLLLKAAALHPRMLEMVDRGELDLKSAIRAQDLATGTTGIVDVEVAINSARSIVIEIDSSCPPKRKFDDEGRAS